MFEALGTVFTQIIGFVGQFVDALTTTDGELAGLMTMFLIGIGISLVSWCVAMTRRIVWGA